MPDITLCASTTCKAAKECYRQIAEASDWQSICDFSKGKEIDDCDNYYPVKWEPKK